MRARQPLLFRVILIGTFLTLFSTPLGQAVGPLSFIAPGAESYVFNLKFGSFGNLDDEFSSPQGIALDRLLGTVWVADPGNQRISQFDDAGNFLFNFGGPGAGDGQFSSPRGVATDADGNLWVADTFNNRVQKFDMTGAFICKTTDPLTTPQGVATGVDPVTGTQAVYVANTGAHSIVKLDSTCMKILEWGGFGGGDGQFSSPQATAVDGAGNVYVADTNNHRIQKFNSSGTFIAKWGVFGSGDSRFTAAPEFNTPLGIAADAAGDIFVGDQFNHRVQKFTSAGTFETMWGWSGSGDGQFNSPAGIAVDGAGRVYVVERDNHRVQRFSPSTADLTHLFKGKWGAGGGGDGQFSTPRGVAVDGSGNVYVADQSNNRIQKFDAAGMFLTKWGVAGSGDGQFSFPRGVAVDGLGNVYVADQFNNRIQVFDADGTFLLKWGTNGTLSGQFSSPNGVAVDGSGSVYVADQGNHRIQKFTGDGTFVQGIGNGITWTDPDPAPTPAAGTQNSWFSSPFGVGVDSSGNIYVADTGNQRIQKFASSGAFVTKWGGPGAGSGQFSSPGGVAVDGSGNVYVVDQFNNRMQKFNSAGRFITKWGSLGSGTGIRDGLFSSPGDVGLNSTGDFIYVADAGNQRIQRFERFGFSLAGTPPSVTIPPGGTATYTITVTGVGPNTLGTSAFLFLLSGLPPATTPSFAPPSGPPSFTSTFTLVTSVTTPPGTYILQIEARGGGQTRVIPLSLVVTP